MSFADCSAFKTHNLSFVHAVMMADTVHLVYLKSFAFSATKALAKCMPTVMPL